MLGMRSFKFFFSGFSAVLIALIYNPVKNSKENAYIGDTFCNYLSMKKNPLPNLAILS